MSAGAKSLTAACVLLFGQTWCVADEEPVSAVWDIPAGDRLLQLKAKWLHAEIRGAVIHEHVLAMSASEFDWRWRDAESQQEVNRFFQQTWKFLRFVPPSALAPVNVPEPPSADGQSRFGQFERTFAHFANSIPGGLQLLPAGEARVQRQFASNAYVGLGVTVASEAGVLTFPSIFPGGAAERAGLENGVRVLAIDAWETRDRPVQEAIERLRGRRGTTVTLRIEQNGVVRELTIRRDFVRFDSVLGWDETGPQQTKWILPADRELAYLKCNQVTSSTVHELRQAEPRLLRTGCRAVLLDLRSSGRQSDWRSVRLVADALIPGGVLWDEVDRTGRVVAILADEDCLFRDYPIIVLASGVNDGPLRALARALQLSGRATLIEEFQFQRSGPQVSDTELTPTEEEWISATDDVLGWPLEQIPIAGGRYALSLATRQWRPPAAPSRSAGARYVLTTLFFPESGPPRSGIRTASRVGGSPVLGDTFRATHVVKPEVKLPESLAKQGALGLAIHLAHAALQTNSTP